MATIAKQTAPDVYLDEDKQKAFEDKFARLTPDRAALAGLLYAIERDDRSDIRSVADRSRDPAPIYIELATNLADNPDHARRLSEYLDAFVGGGA